MNTTTGTTTSTTTNTKTNTATDMATNTTTNTDKATNTATNTNKTANTATNTNKTTVTNTATNVETKTYCNPLDLAYRYQHVKEGKPSRGFREGADPTLVPFKGKYYMFVSMSAGFWWTEDLINFNFHEDTDLLIYDYAPDARQIGDYLYLCASRRNVNCPILRTKDPLTQPFQEVGAPFDFWDPDLFCDDDGRVYLYWGCTNTEPIYGIEMDRNTMMPIKTRVPLIYEDVENQGYQRPGDNGVVEQEHSVVYQMLKKNFNPKTGKIEIPPEMEKASGYSSEAMTKMFLAVGKPYIEGAFMTKHDGKYYLQFATPGTQYNTYCDAVYVGDKPLGPFTPQKSNPFSSVPGGFITGAGHGSTIQDKYGNWWHASTMRISVNHDFERRVGLFPAGFDEDGILFCNQNFADYPIHVPQGKFDPLSLSPQWMLLSYLKPTTASSGSNPQLAVDENIRTWWSASTPQPGQWLCVDLEQESDIRAIQINLADQDLSITFPPQAYGDDRHTRHIDTTTQPTLLTLEISPDARTWMHLSTIDRPCSNAYLPFPAGIRARYVRLTCHQIPYNQVLRVSGLRIFGIGSGTKPSRASSSATRLTAYDGKVSWLPIPHSQGCNVRYGIAQNKLYLSHLVYSATEVNLSTLIKGQKYYIRVDAFNENGITPGNIIEMEASND